MDQPAMKRFVVLPTLLLLGALLTALCLVIVATPANHPLREVPTVGTHLMPGQKVPYGIACRLYVPDFKYRYCVMADMSLTAEGRQIVEVSVFTYRSGLEIGDVLVQWGEPLGADYSTPHAVRLYWPQRHVYVLTQGTFGPSSRVGFVVYGNLEAHYGHWQGFISHSDTRGEG
jgi:hypothetical protein